MYEFSEESAREIKEMLLLDSVPSEDEYKDASDLYFRVLVSAKFNNKDVKDVVASFPDVEGVKHMQFLLDKTKSKKIAYVPLFLEEGEELDISKEIESVQPKGIFALIPEIKLASLPNGIFVEIGGGSSIELILREVERAQKGERAPYIEVLIPQ